MYTDGLFCALTEKETTIFITFKASSTSSVGLFSPTTKHKTIAKVKKAPPKETAQEIQCF